MAINGNFVQYQQKQNSTKQGKQKKDLASFAEKPKTEETLPKQHVDSREIRHLQSSLLKSRALNNNKISFEGYTKIVKIEGVSINHGTCGGWYTEFRTNPAQISEKLDKSYDISKGELYHGYISSKEERKIYVADHGEQVTDEIKRQHDYVAVPNIHGAIRKNNIEDVKMFLGQDIDINAKDSLGYTPLHSAAETGNTNIAKLLIEKGADINAKTTQEDTPLHYAVKGGHLDIAKLLIEKGADINAQYDQYHNTPLHYAAEGGHLDIAKLLIEKGADVNANSDHGGFQLTSLHSAAKCGHLDIAKLLIEKGADINAKTICTLPDYVRERGTEFQKTPLHYVAEGGHLDIAKLLIAKGADINAQYDQYHNTPLHCAAKGGHLDMVKLLISYGANANATTGYYPGNNSPWHYTENHEIKAFLEPYTKSAIPEPSSYGSLLSKNQDAHGDGLFSGVSRAWNEKDDKDNAWNQANSQTIRYQGKLLEVNNKLLELQQQAQANREKLIQKSASQKELDESARMNEFYDRLTDLKNKKGFGKMAGYDNIKHILLDHVCAQIAKEKEGNLSATDRVPTGILFYGPMGTGKTTFATALAGHTECHYERISHERNPEDTFEKIEKQAVEAKKRFEKEKKRTILHLDEIEILARHEDTAGRLKAFLDNSSIDYHCTLFVTTNYPDKIDPALLKGGRFMKVALPPADKKNAADIVKHYAEVAGTNGDIKYEEIAEYIVKHQEQQEAFSNDLIKETVIHAGEKAEKLNKKISHIDLLEAFTARRPDISKTALELFEKNKQLLLNTTIR